MQEIEVNSERWLNPEKLSSRESWKNVSFLPKEIKVSNFGRVRKKMKKGEYIILNAVDNGRKYYAVSIKHKKYYIHRLVAFAFIPNPMNLPEIDHIDGNPANNFWRNIRWVNRKMNMANPNTVNKRKEVLLGYSPIRITQINKEGWAIRTWPNIKKAASDLGLSYWGLRNAIKNGKPIGDCNFTMTI